MILVLHYWSDQLAYPMERLTQHLPTSYTFISIRFKYTNMEMASKKLKVIIVGGSVAGLTLAHSLASAGIDFVLLEARDCIAPQLGATIVTMPNGARILDQLEIYESMKDIVTEEAVYSTKRSDGSLVRRTVWPAVIKDRWV
jgi:FAD dependent monooxygenase